MANNHKTHERRLANAERERTRLPVDATKLNMGNTYSAAPTYWEDVAFTCRDCRSAEVWTAAQQTWWYEEAGGYLFATAIRCRACRAKQRARIAEARARAGHSRG
ncbi:hypothetical protein BH11MYX1_BH11MYX1_13620 [soil metagenome]